MAVSPTFINRVNIALGEDTALVFIGAPAGGITDGKVEEVEVARLAMTFKMLRQMSAIFASKVSELDALEKKAANKAQTERATFSAEADQHPAVGAPSTH